VFVGVAIAAACWLITQLADRTTAPVLPWSFVPLVAAVGLGALQLVPLDSRIHALLSPRGAELRSRLMSEGDSSEAALASRLGIPAAASQGTVSLYPASTRRDLALLTLSLVVFLLGAVLFETARAQVWLCSMMAINGAALAFFGLVQRLTFNGLLYWRVPLSEGGAPFGPFVNRNNAGGLLNLCLAGAVGMTIWAFSRSGFLHHSAEHEASPSPGSWWWTRPWRGLVELVTHLDARTLAALSLAGCITAGILCCLSRGAGIAMIGAGVFTAAMAFLARRWSPRLAWIGLAAVAGLGLVSWVGMSGSLRGRLATLADRGLSSESRLLHWNDALRAVPDFWFLGSGLGTYRFIYVPYQRRPSQAWFYHAENQYLEGLLESGVLGLALMLSMIGLIGIASWRLLRAVPRAGTLAVGIAGLFGLSGQAIHGFFDFALYVPAVVVLFALWCGSIAGRAAHVAARDRSSRLLVLRGNRVLPTALAVAAIAAAAWGCAETAGVAAVEAALKEARLAQSSTETTAEAWQDTARHLASALERRPDDAQAHYALAGVWMERYRAMAYEQLCRESPASADRNTLWAATLPVVIHDRAHHFARANLSASLERLRSDPAVKSNLLPALKHLLLARRACPLLSQVHLWIAQLCGLVVEPDSDATHLERARSLAPRQPELLFQCGRLEHQAGRTDAALGSWRACLDLDTSHFDEILRLVDRQPDLPQAMEKLLPASPALMIELARGRFRAERYAALRGWLLDRAEALIQSGQYPEADRHYLRGAVCALQGRFPEAIGNYSRALELCPWETRWRYELTLILQHQGRLEEAHRQAVLCARAERGNGAYRQLLQEINHARITTDPGSRGGGVEEP
jgi:O-antigen ligase/tetratricopeptide (TPR) repeat protein